MATSKQQKCSRPYITTICDADAISIIGRSVLSMQFLINFPWVTIQQQYQRSQIYRCINTHTIYIDCITVHIDLNCVDTVYWSVYSLGNFISYSQACEYRHLDTRPNAVWQLPEEDTVVWDWRNLRCQLTHMNHIMEVMRAWCTVSFGTLRWRSTLISGQPRQRRYAGMLLSWSEWLLLLGKAHVFLLLGDSYGSLCNHYYLLCTVTQPLCWELGVAERWDCQNRTGPQVSKNKTEERKIQKLNVSHFWMSWKKTLKGFAELIFQNHSEVKLVDVSWRFLLTPNKKAQVTQEAEWKLSKVAE